MEEAGAGTPEFRARMEGCLVPLAKTRCRPTGTWAWAVDRLRAYGLRHRTPTATGTAAHGSRLRGDTRASESDLGGLDDDLHAFRSIASLGCFVNGHALSYKSVMTCHVEYYSHHSKLYIMTCHVEYYSHHSKLYYSKILFDTAQLQ